MGNRLGTVRISEWIRFGYIRKRKRRRRRIKSHREGGKNTLLMKRERAVWELIGEGEKVWCIWYDDDGFMVKVDV